MRRTFEENDRGNNSDSETDSSVVDSVNEGARDRGNNSDSRFDQKVGHFAIQIRRATLQNMSKNAYRNGRTGHSQYSI